MEIYLIRHTALAIEKNICYGQSDVDVADCFEVEATRIRSMLPDTIEVVYASPMKRCKKLAAFLFPKHEIEYLDDLKEINCGKWELKNWNDINQDELNAWMKDFVNRCFPDGENLIDLSHRALNAFSKINQSANSSVAIVTHAGVIRSILSFITQTPLCDCFKNFKLEFGDIIQIKKRSDESFVITPLMHALR